MKLIIKSTVILSAILGAILGFVLLIPVVNYFSCFLFTFIGGAIVYYLKKNNFVGILSTQDGALIGAIAGFTAIIAGSVTFSPIQLALNIIFNSIKGNGMGILGSFAVVGYNIFAIGMLVFFLGLLSAIFNAFSGLIVAYIYQKIENTEDLTEQNDIIIE